MRTRGRLFVIAMSLAVLLACASQYAIFQKLNLLEQQVSGLGAAVSKSVQPPSARTPPPPLPVPTEAVSVDGSASKGSRSAPVTLIVFSDFQCPYCGTFARGTFPTIERDYVATGRVFVVFKHLPLGNHPLAPKAAEAVECAGRQGRFWEMHDRFFSNQRLIDEASIRAGARALGLDSAKFDGCFAGEMTSAVMRDAAQAQDLGIRSTPSFLVGQTLPDGKVKILQRFSGARTYSHFKAALDAVEGSPR